MSDIPDYTREDLELENVLLSNRVNITELVKFIIKEVLRILENNGV